MKKLNSTYRLCKFGDSRVQDLEVSPIRFPIEDEGNFEFDCLIINVNIPELLGLDVQLHYHMKLDLGDITLGTDEWRVPLRVKRGHLLREIVQNETFFY